jgi:hypothetical protein
MTTKKTPLKNNRPSSREPKAGDIKKTSDHVAGG